MWTTGRWYSLQKAQVEVVKLVILSFGFGLRVLVLCVLAHWKNKGAIVYVISNTCAFHTNVCSEKRPALILSPIS